jgi:acyl-coenzyme A synthetase/AMP-(fatty) acid ligase
LLTGEEAAFLLEDAQAAAIITTPELRLEGFAGIEVLASELLGLDGPVSLPETAPEDPAFLIYTSGTTARPKGVLHAQRTVLGRALMREAWQGFGPSDVTLHAGTLNWSYTLGVGLMDPWAAGASAVLFGGEYDAAGWPRLIERLGATIFVAVPTVYRQLLKYGLQDGAGRLASLRHGLCAGEAMPFALLEEWRERAGTELYEALGMTELSTYISSGPGTPIRPGSPGRPQPGRRVAILPVEGGTDPLPPGEVGLLAVHRSDPGLMLGYWRRPEEEAAVFRGEWFAGGDLASLDEDGYVWFQGRADDVIKSFGYRLSPVEIEAALASCAGVGEVAVVGVPIDEAKTLVTACVVRSSEDGAGLDEEALARHARTHLAGYKQPHAYRFVDALPRTANGKVLRRALVEQLRESLG